MIALDGHSLTLEQLTAIAHAKPAKLCGAIAVTVNVLPFSVTGWPTIEGFPPKRCCR